MKDWLGFFYFGGIAVVVSWLTSGCRFGNYRDDPPQTDRLSGFYVTEPKKQILYATTDNASQKEASVNWVPVQIARYMTNPVAFLLFDAQTGQAGLASPKGTRAFPIFINPDLSLGLVGNTGWQKFWTDPDCQSQQQITASGKVFPDRGVPSPPGNSYPLSGRIRVSFQFSTLFDGNCVPTFESLALCYQDYNQCGGSSLSENRSIQSSISDIFDPWFDSGVLALSDFPALRNFSYEVSYE